MGSHVLLSMDEVKQELRRSFSELAIAKLERSWQDANPVTDLAQLKGEWRMQVPDASSKARFRSWMSRHGALLGMKLMSAPEISISPDGRALFRMRVRLGIYEDVVRKPSRFEVVQPSVLRASPGRVTAGRLKVCLPSGNPTNICVTYLDDELMIVRDSDGFADVCWRPGSQHKKQFAREAGVTKTDAVTAMGRGVAEGEAATVQTERAIIESTSQKAACVVSEVVSLEAQLREHQMQLDVDAKLRADLAVTLAALDQEFVDASTGMKAGAADHQSEINRQRQLLQAELHELDRRGNTYKADAAEAERLLGNLLSSARKARSSAFRQQRHGKRFWPWSKAQHNVFRRT